MSLTKSDIRIIKFALKAYEEDTFRCSSGDLFTEERYEMRVAFANLPSIKSAPSGGQLPSLRVMEKSDRKAYDKFQARMNK